MADNIHLNVVYEQWESNTNSFEGAINVALLESIFPGLLADA
jgi:hypothetical protein